jgi:DNA-binding IclR family transcriptional regulator
MTGNGEAPLTGAAGSITVRPARATATRGVPQIVRIKRPSERRSMSRSATRALDLLEYFGEMRRPLRAIEIARMLELSPSSADQLLKTMVDSAHLVFDARNKTYLPSLRLIGISRWIIDHYGADEGLRALVRDVQRQTGAAVTLTVPNDLFMQIVDLAMPRDQHTERGLRISVFGSAIGSAYLSTLGSEALTRLAYRARIPSASMPGLRTNLEQIRRQGFADGQSGEFWSIAVPLPEPHAGTPMVLGLAGPWEEIRSQLGRLQLLMREAVGNWAVHHPPFHSSDASSTSVPAQES